MSGNILLMRHLGTIQESCDMEKNEKIDGLDVFFADDDIADIDIYQYNEMSEEDKKVYCKKVSGVVGCEPDDLYKYMNEVLT